MFVEQKENAFYAKDRKAWRAWLAKNHATAQNVWLILYNKASETPSVRMDEAVEEALCFGWIDSTANKRDAESRYQRFVPRKSNSNWSTINRARVEKLTASGLMTAAGQAMVDLAKATGTWMALAEAQQLVLPVDLQQAFAKNKKAQTNFTAFSNSSKRIILEWIAKAKRPETRANRIAETVASAAKNIKANHPR
jgi:uncharacterized protein YdeI (YjbR/CyaY-like superfamily)